MGCFKVANMNIFIYLLLGNRFNHYIWFMNALYTILLFTLLHFSLITKAQQQLTYNISLVNNAVAMPFSGKAGIIHQPIHFGVRGGAAITLKESEKYRWMQHAHLGYVHQRLIHHVAQLYGENEIDYKLWKSLRGKAGINLGYAHLINTKNTAVYKLNNEGKYERTLRGGVPRFMGGVGFGLGYDISTEKMRIQPFFQYQFWVVAPFVKSYVPVLPNAALLVGTSFSLN
jgi:hypothetical protein